MRLNYKFYLFHQILKQLIKYLGQYSVTSYSEIFYLLSINIQNFLKTLLNWRKHSLAITKGNLIHYPPTDGVYVYFRLYENDLVMVLVNNNLKPTKVNLERFYEVLGKSKIGKSVIGNVEYDLKQDIKIDKKSVLVLEVS